jgi:hypothetical protein
MRRRAASVMVPITILKSAVSDGAGMYAATCCSSDLGSLGDGEMEVWILRSYSCRRHFSVVIYIII